MAKIYFVRHQAHGVVHEFPFTEPPTQNQVAAVAKFCFQSHGFGHPKTPDQPYWTKVIERDVLGADEMPDVPERVLGPAGEAGVAVAEAGKVVVSGAGTVTGKQ
jgi:hypothetical protein